MEEEFGELMEEEIVPKEHSLMDLFEELSFKEKWIKVSAGLKQPKDSGDYKWAQLQMLRLLAPISAVIVPIIFMLLLAVFAAMKPPPAPAIEVKVLEPEEPEELEDIEEIIEEPPDPPEIEITEISPDVVSEFNAPGPPSPDTAFSPQPADFDSVAIIKSPIVMRGILGSRNPGARGHALGRFGGGGGTEQCVLRALRWLKKNQSSDGSWSGDAGGGITGGHSGAKAAFTGMALLAYLAHGETPASEEFGHTVEYAMRFLVDDFNGNTFGSNDRHNYTHPISAYALAEAYGMCKNPELKEVATKAVNAVIQGQHASGGWNYNLNAEDRDDTSYMGWCAQALKAAYIAKLDCPGLDGAMKKAISGFEKNQDSKGGFGYTTSGNGGLSGVGTLCIQLMGAGNGPSAQKGIAYLKGVTYGQGGDKHPIYYDYYNTQVKFHVGGDTWKSWNAQFSPVLMKSQVVIKGGIADPSGKMVDIGYWDSPSEKEAKGHGRVMDTSLCTLMLEVYYRYLPTFQKPDDFELGGGAEEGIVGAEDIEIEIEGI